MNNIPKKFQKLFKRLTHIKMSAKLSFIIIGIVSTFWFLIRVIPKPSRAAYPCMRTAAPIMSSFVLYLLSLSGSIIVFKKARVLLSKSNYPKGILLLLVAGLLFFVGFNIYEKNSVAQTINTSNQFISNLPYGDGVGVFSGRVVWAWNADATNEDCTNNIDDPINGEDGYFLAKNNNQHVIDSMMNDAIIKLSGMNSVKSGWKAIFKDFNIRKNHPYENYQSSQKIFIKINQGGGGWLTNSNDLSFLDAAWAKQYYGMAETSPAVVISVLKQLVNELGVEQSDIYVGDPIAHIYKHNYDQMVAVFPNVHYVDKSHADLGRTQLTPSEEPCIFYSDKGAVMPEAISEKLYTEMENADYLINITALKAHARAGASLTTKNHFGSHTRNSAEHLHPGLIAPENDQPIRTDYGMYRVLIDIMGHEKLGGNTVLFLVDGLWGGPEAVEKPVKWQTAPFNNDWPNSIFISQDQVALESVCLDFLRSEFNDPNGPGKARPYFGAVNDHLLQAADSRFWPDGILYDPENDSTPIGSLGTCEHWNNNNEKLYSKNLGLNKGIELVATDGSLVKAGVGANNTVSFPVIDGDGNDGCWDSAALHQINYTWIEWGVPVDSSDFYGTYKVCWSKETNLLYFYVEITDDVFIDGYNYPNEGYPNFDVLEVFIDEDKSGGLHVFSNNPTWGMNAENAFSYHLVVNAPADGGTINNVIACDIGGTDWDNKVIMNYASHFPGFIMKKEGNKYIWEFSLKIYKDTYDNDNPEASRVILDENKVMGMSLAYCDNDQPDGQRDNFFGSVWVSKEAYNNHWKNADDYGLLRFIEANTHLNHDVVLLDTIPDVTINHGDNILLVDDLNNYFSDPDGDTITYSVTSENDLLTFNITNNKLTVTTEDSGDINAEVVVSASDGKLTTTDKFNIYDISSGILTTRFSSIKIKTYPNPFTNSVTVSFSDNNYTGDIIIMLYNLQGQKIFQKNYHKTVSLFSEKLELNNVPNSMYILRVQYSNKHSNTLIKKSR